MKTYKFSKMHTDQTVTTSGVDLDEAHAAQKKSHPHFRPHMATNVNTGKEFNLLALYPL